MSGQTRLWRRDATYYFRARIPADLVEQFACGTHLQFSLKTKSRAEAVRLKNIESVKFDEECEALRAGRPRTPTALSIPQAQAAAIAAEWAAGVLREDEEDRVSGMTMKESFFSEQSVEYEHMLGQMRRAVARGDTGNAAATVDHELAQRGFQFPKDSPAYHTVAYEFLKAGVTLYQALVARQRGEVVPTPAAVRQAQPAGPEWDSPRLTQTLASYQVERGLPPKTLDEWQRTIGRFTKLHTDLPIGQITRRHVLDFKDMLVAEGKAPSTVMNKITAVRRILGWSMENGRIESNPAAGVRIALAKNPKEKREPYNRADLTRIFSSPLFTAGERPDDSKSGGEAAFWVPLMALFTGARIQELCQLLPGDVSSEEGVPVIWFSDKGEEQKLKNASSRRHVPVHAELVRLGLLDYAAKMQEEKRPLLFPDLRPDNWGHVSGKFSKWYGKFLRETVEITEKTKVFHSFRYSFIDACRACGIEEEVHDAFTGHSGEGVARKVYRGKQFPLQRLVEEMGKLRYPGLDLSKVTHQSKRTRVR